MKNKKFTMEELKRLEKAVDEYIETCNKGPDWEQVSVFVLVTYILIAILWIIMHFISKLY